MGNQLNCASVPQADVEGGTLRRMGKLNNKLQQSRGKARQKNRKMMQLPPHLTRSTPQLFTFDTEKPQGRNSYTALFKDSSCESVLSERGEADGQERSSSNSSNANASPKQKRRAEGVRYRVKRSIRRSAPPGCKLMKQAAKLDFTQDPAALLEKQRISIRYRGAGPKMDNFGTIVEDLAEDLHGGDFEAEVQLSRRLERESHVLRHGCDTEECRSFESEPKRLGTVRNPCLLVTSTPVHASAIPIAGSFRDEDEEETVNLKSEDGCADCAGSTATALDLVSTKTDGGEQSFRWSTEATEPREPERIYSSVDELDCAGQDRWVTQPDDPNHRVYWSADDDLAEVCNANTSSPKAKFNRPYRALPEPDLDTSEEDEHVYESCDDIGSIQLLDETRAISEFSTEVIETDSDDDQGTYETLYEDNFPDPPSPSVAAAEVSNLLACRVISHSMFDLASEYETFLTNAIYYTPDEVHREASDSHTRALYVCKHVIKQQLLPELIIQDLVLKGVISEADLMEVTETKSKREATDRLAVKLLYLDAHQFLDFVDILSAIPAQEHLANLLSVLDGTTEFVGHYQSVTEDCNAKTDGEEPTLSAQAEPTYQAQVLYYDTTSGNRKSIIRMSSMRETRLESMRGVSTFITEANQDPTRFIPLVALNFSGMGIGDQGTVRLTEVLRDCVLELSLCSNNIGFQGAVALSEFLTNASSLQKLNLRLNPLKDEGLECICNALQEHHGVRYLNLQHVQISSLGFTHLRDMLEVNKAIRELDLGYNTITTAVLQPLKEALMLSRSLDTLRLHHTAISVSEWDEICATVCSTKTLKSLDLSANRVGDEGVPALWAILTTTSLQHLTVSDCGFTEAGCAVLASATPHNTSLRSLDWSRNSIGDAGAESISQVLHALTGLQTLTLNICRISNRGFASLIDAVATNSSVKTLQLCYNNIRESLEERSAVSLDRCPCGQANKMAVLMNRVKRLKEIRGLKVQLWGNKMRSNA